MMARPEQSVTVLRLVELNPGGYLCGMSAVTQILYAIEAGDPRAASELLRLLS
jgi:hypothetical protein